MTDLELKLGRPPTEDEVATHVDMSVADLRRLGSDRRMSVVSSINRTIGNGEGEFTAWPRALERLADLEAGRTAAVPADEAARALGL